MTKTKESKVKRAKKVSKAQAPPKVAKKKKAPKPKEAPSEPVNEAESIHGSAPAPEVNPDGSLPLTEVEEGPGSYDEMGNYYLDEIDFLRIAALQARKEACEVRARELRTKAENIRLMRTQEIAEHQVQATSFDKAAKTHTQTLKDRKNELSKKYNINFLDPTVVIDGEFGKVVATDPTRGLPRLKEPEG